MIMLTFIVTAYDSGQKINTQSSLRMECGQLCECENNNPNISSKIIAINCFQLRICCSKLPLPIQKGNAIFFAN